MTLGDAGKRLLDHRQWIIRISAHGGVFKDWDTAWDEAVGRLKNMTKQCANATQPGSLPSMGSWLHTENG